MTIAYHFTSIKWLESILADGAITTTRSNLAGPTRAEVGKDAARHHHSRWTAGTEPQVVWLSSTPEVDASYLGMIDIRGLRPVPLAAHLVPAEYRKTRVRITLELPDTDVKWWPQWARWNKINERWYQAMADGNRNPKEWLLVERPVTMAEFVQIDIDDQQVWPRETKVFDRISKLLHKLWPK